MDDQTWWAAQMSGARSKYALCSGVFNAQGEFMHDGRHCCCGFDPAARRETHRALVREELARLTPSCGGRLSGQQVAYAKGRAGQRFSKIERSALA